MSAEFGAVEKNSSLLGHGSGVMMLLTVLLWNIASQDTKYRYDITSAELSISGESDNSGDSFKRGQLASAGVITTMLLPIFLMFGISASASLFAALFGQTGFLYLLQLLGIGVVGFGIMNIIGCIKLVSQISVIDHTTAPTPDAIADIKRRYQAGEIDEDELEREAAEVWER